MNPKWCDVIIQGIGLFTNQNGTLNCLGVCMLYYLADGFIFKIYHAIDSNMCGFVFSE